MKFMEKEQLNGGPAALRAGASDPGNDRGREGTSGTRPPVTGGFLRTQTGAGSEVPFQPPPKPTGRCSPEGIFFEWSS